MTIEKLRINLAKARIKKGLSAYELSLRIGKNPTYISKVESSENLSITTLFEICAVLEIEPKSLFEE